MAMPIYGNHLVIEQIKREFHYIFESNYPGIPQLEIHEIQNQGFEVGNLPILPIKVMHHKLPVFGFRIHDFTYITDANSIPEAEFDKIYGTKVLVINALQKDDHLSHFTLKEALEVVERVRPEKAYFTHISHNLGLHEEIAKELPANIMLAYDGLSITL
jgi:phosphoribosyl 1,2-cyclic phosphate phosphodiesterase